MPVRLVTDSTSYIDQPTREKLGISVVNLRVNFPDESFAETSVPYDYFYDKMERENLIPTSSQPAPGDFYNIFKEIVARGEEVLGIFISAQMSGTHDSALRAKKLVLEKYPRARIEILDSKTNCMALGLQVIEAAIAAQAGKRMEEVMEAARNIADKVQFYFVPASLKYLQKGGRIGGASALIGSLLKIRPILYVNNGITDLLEKVRGTRSAVKRMTEVLNQEVKMRGLRHLLVHHINDEHAGKDLAACLGREYGREVASFPIGPVIGLHVGPGTVGIVFCTET